MTTRARLLAILKEPDRFGISDWAKHSDGAHNQRASEICADKNARHRLKRLCEEIAKVANKWESAQGIPVDQFQDGAATAAHGIAQEILALGEDNEHS
jgi:hypothetical protein